MTKKRKVHELLAVEQEIKSNAERAKNQSIQAFSNQVTHFTGFRRTFRPFSVDEEKGEEAGERLEAETKLVRTVREELEKTFEVMGKFVDHGLTIDVSNTVAKADLEIDGVVLAKDVPATFLLQLEKRLREIRTVLKSIPTFDPVKIWEVDPGADKSHVLRANPIKTIRKQRTRKYNVMVEATKEHPAQVDIVEVDEPVGEICSYEWTGLLSQGEKTQLLERVENLLIATKKARSAANSTEVEVEQKVAKEVFDYLLKPIR